MSDDFPKLQIFLTADLAPLDILAGLRRFSGAGYAELKTRIALGSPVLEIGMFTNSWYDAEAADILRLLGGWEATKIGYSLYERAVGAAGATQITLEELRNIIEASQGDLSCDPLRTDS